MEANGVLLTFADLTPSSVLEVKTSRGDFSVPVGKLGYGAPQRTLKRQVEFQRVPTSRQIVQAATEDAYPSAVAGPQNRIHVAYIAFTHGEGFQKRPPITSVPQDFSFLGKPTGGDQVMLTEFDGNAWSALVALTDAGGDLFGTATALDGRGCLWVFWSANVDDNWDIYGKVRTGRRWSQTIRITSAPGSDFYHAAATDSEGRVWLAWQGFGETNSDIYVARQEEDAFGKPTAVADSPANDWAPAIAASQDGQVAVAWDTYERGNYDVLVKVWQAGRWGEERADHPLGADHPPKLVEAQMEKPAGPSGVAREEAKQVAAIRAYRAQVGGKKLRIVRGEFHRHTEISSDGSGDGTIFDMWRYGIDMAAMDWIGSGDHDNGNGREFSWWFTQKTTSLFNVPGAFTPMYTYERSCGYPDGHRNAVFARRGIRPLARLRGGRGKAMDDLPAEAPRPNTPDTLMFYKYLRHFDGVCASHTSGTNMGTDWRDNDPQVEPIVEIYQGDRQNYERPGAPRSNSADYSIGGWRPFGFVSLALMKGYRLGFQSSSDHISTHMSYCNVWVEEPTREAILDGLRRRRVYGATDNIIADVRCGEHFMGEEFAVNKPPTLEVKLTGTAPFAEVVIVKDNEYVYSAAPKKRTIEFKWTDMSAKPGKTSYYYVRGTQVGQSTEHTVRSSKGEKVKLELNNGEIVWVSPMWITYKP